MSNFPISKSVLNVNSVGCINPQSTIIVLILIGDESHVKITFCVPS